MFVRSYIWKLCRSSERLLGVTILHGGDGLLYEAEMNNVALTCRSLARSALVILFEEALSAFPLRTPMPQIGVEQRIPD
jgi:hypothetical protein